MEGQILVDRYELSYRLGQGGMGEVWEAYDRTLQRAVAVKLISALAGSGAGAGEARDRFLREARLTAGLQHPGIVTVHDLGEVASPEGSTPFLVMERVRGEGLDAKLRGGAVTLRSAASWGEQICRALAAAHDAGIVHRDIKPGNIMISDQDRVTVLDFGIARAIDSTLPGDRLTPTGWMIGTPQYMAPEQARGCPEPASDLYAVGCLLFELVTGRLPFEAPDSASVLAAHLNNTPPLPSTLVPGIPSQWDRLIASLLAKSPGGRPDSATHLADRLLALADEGQSVSRTRDGSAYTPTEIDAPSEGADDLLQQALATVDQLMTRIETLTREGHSTRKDDLLKLAAVHRSPRECLLILDTLRQKDRRQDAGHFKRFLALERPAEATATLIAAMDDPAHQDVVRHDDLNYTLSAVRQRPWPELQALFECLARNSRHTLIARVLRDEWGEIAPGALVAAHQAGLTDHVNNCLTHDPHPSDTRRRLENTADEDATLPSDTLRQLLAFLPAEPPRPHRWWRRGKDC
ncbi:serine/threonine-protein kinase [Streptomyces longisporoflavus]|uniref:non-specific serine/threonine protein kinase n=1 Tax=Streptomyces longisporoflavus TaxID=28044 RepID=A0ABW7R5D0_9ACTN